MTETVAASWPKADTVKRRPNQWMPAKALSFPDMWDLIQRHREPKNPISPELMAVLFFEESLFCNIIQVGAGKDAAVGFGQMPTEAELN